MENDNVCVIPVVFTSEEVLVASDYLKEVRKSIVDVIVVDGTEWTANVRPICFRAGEEEITPGGIIVVDDSSRYRELRQTNRARRVNIFESVGPGRFGVSHTYVSFYCASSQYSEASII